MTPEQEQALWEANSTLYGNWLDVQASQFAAMGMTPDQIRAQRDAAMAAYQRNFQTGRANEQARELMRQEGYRYLNGSMDPNLSDFQTQYTAMIPRQFSEQNSAQAAQMASNGLSGSGLAKRAARQSRLNENDTWNSGMNRAGDDYRNSLINNRALALQKLKEAGDTEGMVLAQEAMKSANRRNERLSDKSGGAQNAYEFIGGVRNGISGENGVF